MTLDKCTRQILALDLDDGVVDEDVDEFGS
jgi:hypothetical protein